MGTQRYISTSFWDDEWIQTCDPSEKLLYLYLMTNPLTNIAGVYKITVRRISFDTGFNDDVIKYLFQKFEKAGKAFRIGEYVALPSWPKHQKWEKAPKIREGIIICLRELPENILRELVKIKYRFDLVPVFDTLGIPYTYPSSYSDSDSEFDSDSENTLPFDPDDGVSATEETPSAATANAVAVLSPTQVKKTKKNELSQIDSELYARIKGWFERDDLSRLLMYQDSKSAARNMKSIKTMIERCNNIARMAGGHPADVAASVLKLFRYVVLDASGKTKLRVSYSPVGLTQQWVWDIIISECKSFVEASSPELVAQKVQESLAKQINVVKKGGVRI